MALKARIVNLRYLIMLIENVGDQACAFFMLPDPRMQGTNTTQRQKAVERRAAGIPSDT